MSKRDDWLLLEDIIEACDKINKYTKGMSYEDFVNDDKTIDAVVRNFEVIGEAANRLSNETLLHHQNLQWRQIIGLRNRLIHGYFGVDYQILWNIMKENLNQFREQIVLIVKNSF